MAATNHGYNVLKMPGSGGVITIASDEKEAVRSQERAYQTAAVECSEEDGAVLALQTAPKKKKNLPVDEPQDARAPDGLASGLTLADEAPSTLA